MDPLPGVATVFGSRWVTDLGCLQHLTAGRDEPDGAFVKDGHG